MKKIFETYGFLGVIQLFFFKIRTILLFPSAKIVRFPIRIRGRKFMQVGKNFTTGFNCRFDAFPVNTKHTIIKIGNNVQINDYVHIAAIENIEIRDNVLIASKVFITDHNHGNYSGNNQDSPESIPSERKLYASPVIIEENVWLGEYVSILPGVTIGKGSIIGSMSLVNTNIPPFCIAVGSPAKVIKRYNFITSTWDKI